MSQKESRLQDGQGYMRSALSCPRLAARRICSHVLNPISQQIQYSPLLIALSCDSPMSAPSADYDAYQWKASWEISSLSSWAPDRQLQSSMRPDVADRVHITEKEKSLSAGHVIEFARPITERRTGLRLFIKLAKVFVREEI